MSKILCIDTATDICTVTVFEDEQSLIFRDSGEERSHAVQLGVFINEILEEICLSVADLDAIAISKGPGSYTGLRIGVSMAKGLCYAQGIPLISVSTLHAMCYGVSQSFIDEHKLKNFYFCPMLDARRMEVYTALYDPDYLPVYEISAKILDENSFNDTLDQKPVIFFGNGAGKFREVTSHKNALFYDDFRHTSRNMRDIAFSKFENKDFEDVAYFEPFYLKDFIATVPRKNILG